jgi:hypothetical protein
MVLSMIMLYAEVDHEHHAWALGEGVRGGGGSSARGTF